MFPGLTAPLLQFWSADTDLNSHFNEISQANKGPSTKVAHLTHARGATALWLRVAHIEGLFQTSIIRSDQQRSRPSLLSLCVDADNLSVESSGISGCVGENFSVF